MPRRALVADLLEKSKVDVLPIWGGPRLDVRRTLVSDLLSKSKVDLGQPALNDRRDFDSDARRDS